MKKLFTAFAAFLTLVFVLILLGCAFGAKAQTVTPSITGPAFNSTKPISSEIWVHVGGLGSGYEVLYQSIKARDTSYTDINHKAAERTIIYTCLEAPTKLPLIITLTELFDGVRFSIFKSISVEKVVGIKKWEDK